MSGPVNGAGVGGAGARLEATAHVWRCRRCGSVGFGFFYPDHCETVGCQSHELEYKLLYADLDGPWTPIGKAVR